MRILKDKKGAAIETAIVFLILVFSFCFILTATSLLGAKRAKLEQDKNTLRLEQEQLTEDFLAYLSDPEGTDSFSDYSQDKYQGYVIEETSETGGDTSLTVKRNGEVVLYLLGGTDAEGNAVLKSCKTTQ